MPPQGYPKPPGVSVKAGDNALTALMIAQIQREANEAKKAVDEHKKLAEESKAEAEKHKKELEGIKKKKELDDKLHKDMRKELDSLKSRFDPQYAVEKKTIQKETMQRARYAKQTVKQATKPRAKSKSTGTRATSSKRAK